MELGKGSIRPGLFGLDGYEPADPRSFGLTVTAEIGPEKQEAADIFTFMVCTPDWLGRPGIPTGANRVAAEPWDETQTYVWGRRVLFLRKWNYGELLRIVNDLLSRSKASDWPAAAAQLSPYLAWEFEDYQS